MNCPCENCICLPVCKHKKYYNLFTDCSLIKKYIPFGNRDREYLYQLEEIMKPTRWRLIKNKKGRYPLVMSTYK